MGMTIDDMYDWLYRLKSELVVYMPKEWHVPMRCSIQDAITFSRKYQMLKADYENRLKADMVAMLEDLDLQVDELSYKQRPFTWDDTGEKGMMDIKPSINDVRSLIQERINTLRGEEN